LFVFFRGERRSGSAPRARDAEKTKKNASRSSRTLPATTVSLAHRFELHRKKNTYSS